MSSAPLVQDLFAICIVLAIAWGAGAVLRLLAVRRPGPWKHAWDLDLILGLTGLHVTLLGLDLVNVAWSRWTLCCAVLAVGGLLILLGRLPSRVDRPKTDTTPHPPVDASRSVLSWPVALGAVAAAVPIGVLAVLSRSGRIATPDFVYHWGIKAHRYLLAGGIDWGFLTSPQGPTPGYPNLIPNLFALTGVVEGGFHETGLMLWTPVFAVLLIVGAYRSWLRIGLPGEILGIGLAGLASMVCMFATGYRLAGGADLALATAIIAALPALFDRRDAEDDLRIGAAAALAAGCKQEGLVFAVLLLGVYVGGRILRWRHEARLGSDLGLIIRCLLPAFAVVVPWWVQAARYGLLAHGHGGWPPHWDRLPRIFALWVRAIETPEWHGLAWIVAVLPLLLLFAASRRVALLLSLQFVAYTLVYLGHPGEVTYYVLSNAPRLLFHLVPAAAVGLLAALASISGDRKWSTAATRSVALVLLIWAGIGCSVEQWKAGRALSDQEGTGVVAQWRFGQRGPESFRRYLEKVDQATYPGSRLAFRSAVGKDQDFYLQLWAAYYLAGNQVVPADQPGSETADYLVTYNLVPRVPPGRSVLNDPSGRVYWLGK